MPGLVGSRFSNPTPPPTPNRTPSGNPTTADITLASPPDDSISALAWSPVANHLAVASWDSKVRIYDVTQHTTGVGVALFDFEGPVLDCHWTKNGAVVVGASADKTARMLDLGGNSSAAQQVGSHDGPVKSVRFLEGIGTTPIIATGSWDKTVRYWDPRVSSTTPIATLQCPERIYGMDTKDNMLALATAERHIISVNLNSPTTIFMQTESPLKHQTRCITCFEDGKTVAIGGIEGRVSIHALTNNNSDRPNNFSFKCHRDQVTGTTTDIYPVNAISVHPLHGTFSTAGSDGTFHFWDRNNKHRLTHYQAVGGSITATGYNYDGKLWAYAISYDWSKGYVSNYPQYPNKVMLHQTSEDDCHRKTSGSSGLRR
ncbi:putative nuclear pore complex protein SonA [Coleophoma crateriformis]|uniref:Putative nuclear pore complex protein SonA n=1 Tax=Coleophoma crateriformis TaxID=565419 RepID=A0A3D8RPI7_9HELO|nr:putative nuclear pore complex protein SonA [Coleophoma crateriformis]